MRRLWVCGLILLAACAGTPNTQATQTRTSEVATNTALAGVLPTQNAAVPPTPVPTPNAGPTPNGVATLTAVVAATRGTTSQVPTDTYHFDAPAISTLAPFTPTRLSPSPSVIGGSWVAYSPMTHIRFFAPPSLVEDRQFNSNHRYSLASPSNIYDFEALDIYRFVGARGGDFARTWQAEMDTFQKGNNVGPLSVTSGPQQQQVAAYQGNVGQFHYNQQDNGLQISGTAWVGQVGGDEVAIIYRCSPDREGALNEEFGQVIATIDFGAQVYGGHWEGKVELNFAYSASMEGLEKRLREAGVTVVRPVGDEGFGYQLQIEDADGMLIKINQIDPALYR